ncbi:DNA alkylation repair protein [Vagococcus sp. BWB3-3]|uniref:DNA alkylation repair protein n=1 Tax=Vagococcus allomyrinae TaxID=2794353 RepID=A0A940ST42_9ENTE|nr:DNA alkylation repair protein [Vagococcus allomyrinae]MBP1039915.1 DNA alkylation repair protein [Vagococcus allomyrinae]
MALAEVMGELAALGTAQTRKTFAAHGAPADCYGVKIGDMKKQLLKKVKHQHDLCLALFATGNSDAQYLAGLAIDPQKMSKKDINRWLSQSSWSAIDETIVAGVAAENPFGLVLGRDWLAADIVKTQNVGWLTYGKYLALCSDEEVDRKEVKALLQRIEKEIHRAPNAIRYSMNQFIIYVGSYCPDLTEIALKTAANISEVEITLATKGCRLPSPTVKIQKLKENGRLGIKRKRVIC